MSKQDDSIITHLIGGGLAGLVADGVVHPIDTVRARLMTSSSTLSKSATTTLVNIASKEGIGALYRGFSAVAVGTIPGHALYFAGYEWSKKTLNRMIGAKTDSNFFVHLASGFVADIFGALAWNPMDVVKQRLQVQKANPLSSVQYSGSMDAVKKIIQQDGIKGLFRGMGASILTYGPYVSLYFALYEQMKIFAASDRMFGTHDVAKLPFYIYLLGAAGAGSISAAVTTPLDVIKTRIQVQENV
jgi:hypothetical protein